VSPRVPWVVIGILARRFLVGSTVIYAGTSLLLGGQSCARSVFHALAAGWAFGLAAGSWRLAARTSRGCQCSRLELLVTNVALSLLVAELALRAYGLAWGGSLLLGSTLQTCRLAPGHDYGHGLRGNQLGYPGPDFQVEKKPGVFRIAALGDSFAVGPAVPYADNYLHLLETTLPATEVYNFGVSGTGPREYLQILRQDVWAYQPDLVLVSVFVGNDITEELATPRHLDVRQHALYQLCARGWRLARERIRQGQPPPTAEDRLARPALSAQTFREIEARRIAVCVTPVPPVLERKWQRALGYLDRIIRECPSHKVPLVVVLIPDEFQANPHVRTEALATAALEPDAIDIDLPQRRLAGFFAERGIRCLDLLPVFRGVSQTYAPCDTHWNVRGNHLAADAIRRWLVSDSSIRARQILSMRPSSGR
jgi:hypothetical protein